MQSWCFEPSAMLFDTIDPKEPDQPQLAGTACKAERSAPNTCAWGSAIGQKMQRHMHKHGLMQCIPAQDCARHRQRAQKG